MDGFGNVFFCGTVRDGYIEYGGEKLILKRRISEPFLTKMNSECEITWFKKIEGNSSSNVSGGEMYFVDNNTIYWIGYFPVDLDLDASDKIMIISELNSENEKKRIAIQKLNKNGDFLDLYVFKSSKSWTTKFKILNDSTILNVVFKDRYNDHDNIDNTTHLKKLSGVFSSTNPLKVRSCNSYYWTEAKESYTESGTYYFTRQSGKGKDSILELNLTIESNDKSLRRDEKHIYSNAKDVTFQWLDCENNYKPINRETDSVFQFRESGTYCVEITSKYCDNIDTSECVAVEMIGIHPNDLSRYYSIDYHVMIDRFDREHVQLNANEVKMIPFRDGPLYGFVKKGNKDKWCIKPRFEQVFAIYQEGAIVKDTTKGFHYGLINEKGKYVIEPLYKNLLQRKWDLSWYQLF